MRNNQSFFIFTASDSGYINSPNIITAGAADIQTVPTEPEDTGYKNANGQKGFFMEFLKTILGDELYKQVETAINAHNGKEENKDKPVKLFDLSSGEYTSINKYNDEVNARTNAETQLKSANDLIEQLKKGAKDDPDTQKKIGDYETRIAELENELAATKLETAISEAIRNANGQDIDYLTFKLKAMDGELKLDDDGKIKGIDDKIATLKTQFPTQFSSSNSGNGSQKIDPQPLPGGNPDKNKSVESLSDAISQFYSE